jgi:hypothetical protein
MDVNVMQVQKKGKDSDYQHEVELIPQEIDSEEDINEEDTEIPIQYINSI